MICCVCTVSALHADEAAKPFSWTPLKIQTSVFSDDLGMLGAERDEYASHLANSALACIADGKGAPAATEIARRLLTLALNLSPRNKRAVVANFQLAKGIIPTGIKPDYSPPTLARLLLTRGQGLAKQEGDENLLLSRMFIQISAELDPKNEDAVYASEVDRIDHGAVDWSLLTRERPPAPTAPTAPAPAGNPGISAPSARPMRPPGS